ncbi:MAG: phosphatidylserine decarboxylase [Bryobacteraceae bacterium]
MPVVKDGVYYALALWSGGALVSYLAGPWLAVPLFLAGIFCLYFFRDPERPIPAGPVMVSPADGKVVAVEREGSQTRISIFLNIFDVHVNRTPISGTIQSVRYKPGKFLVASREEASSQNEQNTVTVSGEGTQVVFKQIAGLIARRIVFYRAQGDKVRAGERVGLIKFGSRVDVIFGPEWEVAVDTGIRVSAGSSVLARRTGAGTEPRA